MGWKKWKKRLRKLARQFEKHILRPVVTAVVAMVVAETTKNINDKITNNEPKSLPPKITPNEPDIILCSDGLKREDEPYIFSYGASHCLSKDVIDAVKPVGTQRGGPWQSNNIFGTLTGKTNTIQVRDIFNNTENNLYETVNNQPYMNKDELYSIINQSIMNSCGQAEQLINI